MDMFLSITIIAILYGTYDLLIKLGAGRIDPALGAMFTQITSVLTVGGYLAYQSFIKQLSQPKTTPQGLIFVGLAGVLIATALLVFLFTLLQDKEAKATTTTTTTLPTVLILRNITLVLLGIIVLRENLSFIKALGIGLSLFGIYLISF